MKKLAVLALLTPAAALASGGEGGHHEPHVSNWLELTGHMDDPAIVWMGATFALFVYLVYRSTKRPLAQHLKDRSDEVRVALEEAAKAKAEAEARAREYEERLSQLDGEIEELKASFQSRGEAELHRLEEAGKAQAARILKDAEDTIFAEVEKAQNELKAEAARLSIEIAEKRIAEALGKDDHKRLTEGFLEDIAA